MAERRNRQRPLSLRQQKFVEQFLIAGVARVAAIRAGYAPANVGKTAWRLRRLPHVAEAIRLGRASEARRAQVGRERVLLELARIAFSDIGELLDWDGDNAVTLRPKAEVSPHLRAAVQEIAAGGKDKPTRVRLHSKSHALDAIARHLGLFDKIAPTIDLQAKQRDRRDARTILLERFKRLAEAGQTEKQKAERAAASLNAGAPLDLPSFAVAAADTAAGATDGDGASLLSSAALPSGCECSQSLNSSSPPSSPSPPERGRGQGEGVFGDGMLAAAPVATHTPAPALPALPSTFSADFVRSRK